MLHPDYVGFRIWYADGSVSTSLDGAWEDVPSTGVQFVTIYEKRTYPIYVETEWITENYCVQFHSQDYYWLDADGRPGAAIAQNVPDGLPQGSIKTGSWIPESDFWTMVAEAQELRVTP